MIFSYKKFKLNVELFSKFDSDKKSILFLHGFTGSAKDWKEIAKKINSEFNIMAFDLIGHGKSDSPPDIKFYKSDKLAEQILFVLNNFNIKKVTLCGYSMGGRAALNFAYVFPEKISALVLESTSAGIVNEKEKVDRIKSDEKLAQFILNNQIEEFVAKWMEIEIFKSQKKLPAEKLEQLKIAKLQNSKIGLANSLRGFGTGVMPYLGKEVKKTNVPVLLITGELDEKFTTINKNLVKQFPNAEHKIIAGAGHNMHLEQPDDFSSTLGEFLNQF